MNRSKDVTNGKDNETCQLNPTTSSRKRPPNIKRSSGGPRRANPEDGTHTHRRNEQEDHQYTQPPLSSSYSNVHPLTTNSATPSASRTPKKTSATEHTPRTKDRQRTKIHHLNGTTTKPIKCQTQCLLPEDSTAKRVFQRLQGPPSTINQYSNEGLPPPVGHFALSFVQPAGRLHHSAPDRNAQATH